MVPRELLGLFIRSRDSSRIAVWGGGREGREEASVMMVTSLNVSYRFSPMMTSFISLARVMLDIERWYWGNNSFRGKGWGEGEGGCFKTVEEIIGLAIGVDDFRNRDE